MQEEGSPEMECHLMRKAENAMKHRHRAMVLNLQSRFQQKKKIRLANDCMKSADLAHKGHFQTTMCGKIQ